MNEIVKVTFRPRAYLYERIKLVAKRYNQTINDTIIELLENGLLKEIEMEAEFREYRKEKTQSNDSKI